ncbi:MAG TPA: hypothetical protein VE621_03710 [Bryobacteraceae bacterium]|jgi:hypothetical protein|nr:hypothetical protein [Bryobacteraceae bacterium]
MTTEEFLRRHFSRMGARLHVAKPGEFQREKIRINIGRDRSGEYFDIRCQSGVSPEILDVQPERRHLVLMVRDGSAKNKFLLGRDERHWFAAAVPGDNVHDVRTAIDSLRPVEVEGRRAIRQGEWFFVADRSASHKGAVIHRNEPLSRGSGSKPHICEELMRHGGETVMVSSEYPTGISPVEQERLISTDARLRALAWRRMTRDADVYARGDVRHRDHKTIYLDGWHRVYMNRERMARHAPQIAFLD